MNKFKILLLSISLLPFFHSVASQELDVGDEQFLQENLSKTILESARKLREQCLRHSGRCRFPRNSTGIVTCAEMIFGEVEESLKDVCGCTSVSCDSLFQEGMDSFVLSFAPLAEEACDFSGLASDVMAVTFEEVAEKLVKNKGILDRICSAGTFVVNNGSSGPIVRLPITGALDLDFEETKLDF